MDKFPKVGVGIMLLKDGKVLLGKRHDDPKKAKSELHGEGSWTMPGGKLEFGETLKDACFREVFEETGIKINKDSLQQICVLENILEDAHFITFGFICQDFEGEAKVKEPEEIVEWRWFDLKKLPTPLYKPSEEIIKAYQAYRQQKDFGEV